ncbi:hypothetical protein [Microcystis phage Mwe-JY26]
MIYSSEESARKWAETMNAWKCMGRYRVEETPEGWTVRRY